MTELATQRADQDGRDVQSELEQLTEELTREQQELKRIKTVRQAHTPPPPPKKPNHCLCNNNINFVINGCLVHAFSCVQEELG